MRRGQRWIQAWSRLWNQFFFEPISTASLGLFRIFFSGVVLISLVGKVPFRELFYSDAGLVSFTTMDAYFPGPHWLYFRWVPAQDPELLIYFIFLICAAILLLVGLFSRVMSVIVFLGLISLSNRNFFVENSGDDLLRINAFFLMFAPCGQAYSLDQWRKLKAGTARAWAEKHAPWAQRLLQLQLAFLYLNTSVLKLPGHSWQDGTAMYYALQYIELRRFELKPFFYYLWQIKLMTYGVLIAEFAAGSLIWFRKTRYWVLGAAMVLHFGINLTMQFPVFQYVMMSSLLLFVYPEDVERWVQRWARARPEN